MNRKSGFRSLDKSLKKQRIIDTAVNVFHQKGYRAATLDDVANELGLTKAALYHYVASKEDLLSVIYLQALENFFAKAYEIGELQLPPGEKLRTLIRHHIKHIIVDNLAMFAVFFSEENQLPEKDFQKISQEKLRYTRVVEALIEEGISQGHFRKTDAWLQACAIIGMCNWLYKWYKPGASPNSPDDIADHFIGLLERGYLAGEDETARAGGEVKDVSKPTSPPRKTGDLLAELKRHSRAVTQLADELDKSN
jgi:AcrR family transcriptional regulator